jgi:hypothetical protein
MAPRFSGSGPIEGAISPGLRSYLVQWKPNFRSIRSKDDSTTLNLAQLKDGPAGLVNTWK